MRDDLKRSTRAKLEFRLRTISALAVAAAMASGCAARAANAEQIRVPSGFSVSIVSTKVQGARFMAFGANGDLLVAETGLGRVVALRPGAPADADPVVVAEGLPIAHGLAVRGDTLYIAAWSGVTTMRYPPLASQPAEPLFSDMPQGGVHNHRAIAVGADGTVFVSSGSTCNVCAEPDPRFATVLRYDADGTHGRIYASGLRNASGLAFDDRGQLWAVINERDNLGDNVPPEDLVPVKDGGKYGWPYCHASESGRVPNPEYGDASKCAGTVPSALTFQAHSAPLQIAFYHGSQFPSRYRGALFVAYHGSWNRSVKTGYKVVAVIFKDGHPDHVEDFATGWLGTDQSVSGRPAGVAIGPEGSLYVSSDLTGYIYRISYKQ